MALTRRMLFSGAALAASALVSSGAEACSLLARVKPINFSDDACRKSLRAFVNLINAAPALSDAQLTTKAEELRVGFGNGVADALVEDTTTPFEDFQLYRAWTRSGGKRDRAPVRLSEINFLKHQKGIALYQFTLRRERFFPEVTEDGGSCFGSEPAHFSADDRSYLGVFHNNKLRRIEEFEVWREQL